MTPLEIGFAVAGLLVLVLGSVATGYRWLVVRVDNVAVAQAAALEKTRDELHSRINEIRDQYVRRDDLMTHMNHLERGQKELKTAIEALTKRFDQALNAMALRKP